MRTVAFFNNKGGVGKTALVYHLAHLFADRGLRVVAADLDPQANLTAMCLTEDRLEEVYSTTPPPTASAALRPLLTGTGDIAVPRVERIRAGVGLVMGDLSLSQAEDELSGQWPRCLDRDERAFRVLSAFWRVIAAAGGDADVALIDVGPNLGAINRAALLAAEAVVVPLAPDLFSLQGVTILGPTLGRWRREWADRRERAPDFDFALPTGSMRPIGYVVLQHGIRVDRPVKEYLRWIDRIPHVYREAVLGDRDTAVESTPTDDPHCLALLKHYRSLMPLAMEAHKPMFHLKPADGAIGAHVAAVRDCFTDFLALGRRICTALGIDLP